MSSNKIYYILNPKDKLLLNLIDTSHQFHAIQRKINNLRLKYSIKYDHSVAQTIVDEKFTFFDTFSDFFSQLCDVKIERFVFNNPIAITLDYCIQNYKDYNNIFRSSLFLLYPIYSCLKLKSTNELFKSEHVKLYANDDLSFQADLILPQKYLTTEEIFLVNSLSYLTEFNQLPVDVDEFWTLFIFSLCTNITQDYAYKSFINKWHFEKKIPLPELNISSISPANLATIIKFFYHFIQYFYTNDMYLSKATPIKACFAKKIKTCNQNIEIYNNIINVEEINCPLIKQKKIKILPCILNKDSNYCLYYKTTDDVLIEFQFEQPMESKIFTLYRNQFKLVFTLSQSPKSIRVLTSGLNYYLGTKSVEESKIITIDSVADALEQKLFLESQSIHLLKFGKQDAIDFNIYKCNKVNRILPNFVRLDSKLYAIEASQHKCNTYYTCTIQASSPSQIAYYFLNFLNVKYSIDNNYKPYDYFSVKIDSSLWPPVRNHSDQDSIDIHPIQLTNLTRKFFFVFDN